MRHVSLIATTALTASMFAGCSGATEPGAPLEPRKAPAAVAGAAAGPDDEPADGHGPAGAGAELSATPAGTTSLARGAAAEDEATTGSDDAASEGLGRTAETIGKVLDDVAEPPEADVLVAEGSGGGDDPLVFAEGDVQHPSRLLVLVDAGPGHDVTVDWLLTCADDGGSESSEGTFGGRPPLEQELSLPVDGAVRCTVWAGAHLEGRSRLDVKVLAGS